MNKKLILVVTTLFIKADIKFHGNTLHTKEALLEILKDADMSDPNEVRITLDDTGYFTDINIKKINNNLDVYLTETPLFSKIIFSGNSQIKTEQCIEITNLKPGLPCDKYTIQNAILRLEKAYSAKYMDVNIQYKLAQEGNAISVEFIVNEGGSGQIKEIDFIGNKKIPSKKLSKLLPQNRLGFFTYTYDLAWIEMYKKILLDYAGSLGLYDFTIHHIDIVKTGKNQHYKLIMKISEGNAYKITKFKLNTNNLKINEKNIQKLLVTNIPLNNRQIKTLSDNIIKEAYNEGLDIAVKTKVNKLEIKNNIQEVEVELEFIKSSPMVINNIEVSGNNISEGKMILNVAKLMPGQKINQFSLIDAKNRLESTGFFKNVEIDVDSKNSNLSNIKIKLIENKMVNLTTQLQLGYGNAPMISKDTEKSSIFYGLSLGYQSNNMLGKGYMFDTGVQYLFNTLSGNISFGQSPQINPRGFGWNIGLEAQWVSTGVIYKHNTDLDYINDNNNYLLSKDEYKPIFEKLKTKKGNGDFINPRAIDKEWDIISGSVSFGTRFNITNNFAIGVIPSLRIKHNDMKSALSDYPRFFNSDHFNLTETYADLSMPFMLSYKKFKHNNFFGFAQSITPSINPYKLSLQYTASYNLPIDDDGYGEIGVKVDAGTMKTIGSNTYWQHNFLTPGVMTGIASWGPKDLTSMLNLGSQQYATARARIVIPSPFLSEYLRFYAFAAIGTAGSCGIDSKPIDAQKAEDMGIKESWTESDIVNNDFNLRVTTGAGVILALSNSMFIQVGYNHPLKINGPFDRPQYFHLSMTSNISN